MKKYVKPELFYERFELSQHIANCFWEMTLQEIDLSCVGHAESGKGLDGQVLFTGDRACTWKIGDGIHEAYCYQAGPDGMNTFIS